MIRLRTMFGLAFLSILGICLAAAPDEARGGSLHPDFQSLLSRTAPGQVVSGLVMLRDQVELARVEEQIRESGMTSRWRRHQTVVVEAQEVAARMQGDLLVLLARMQSEGTVRSFRSFWITNMVAVEGLPEAFTELAARSDVGTIFEDAKLELREGWPEGSAISKSGPRVLPDNLVCVNVGPVWDDSIRGQGRLVCSFDTGADGNHEAFAAKWRGLQSGVDWSWAWRDPYTGSTFPYDSGQHGTHVMGIMVGEKPDGSAIGVAPEAEWIAAGILIGYNVSAIIACYQWAADPDGDPGTVSDVPDVVNNSWGTSGNCDQTYWNAIDVVEAAGVVNTIAVDNTGPNPGSVNSPESRALTPNVNFGVGNVNPHIAGYPIASSSGRGPSPCDGTSIKPEVAAPGTQIYSSLPNNNYGSLTGTSMACPHTSGAVALLRQVNPDLTVDEIKTALMATALDRGAVGEDNDYGWGIIDIAAAAASVAPPLPANPPENLQASVAEDEVTLTWEEPREVSPENQLRSYLIYRAPSGEPFPGVPLAELRAIFSPPVYVDHDVPPGLWHYVVTAEYENGESGPSNEVEVETLAPSSVGLVRAADGLSLLVGPNPLVESTIIRFRSRGLGPVTLSVFDSGGRKLRTLVSGAAVPAGESAAAWDARDDAGRQVPSGVYFVRLEEAEHELQRAVTVLR